VRLLGLTGTSALQFRDDGSRAMTISAWCLFEPDDDPGWIDSEPNALLYNPESGQYEGSFPCFSGF
jgi:hypothetical protein